MKSLKSIKPISIEKQYFFSTIILFCFIALLYTIQDSIGYETVSMILLLIIFILPLFNFSKGPIILSAIISALAWDYYFIPPHFTMHIAKTEDVVMLFMFFIVATTNGVLATKVNTQKYEMLVRERKLTAFFELVKELATAKNSNEFFSKAALRIKKVFGSEAVFFFPESSDRLSRITYPAENYDGDELEWLAAEASFKLKAPAGKTTDSVSNAEAIYFPVINNEGVVVNVIGIKIGDELKSDKGELEFLKDYVDELKMFLFLEEDYSKP